MTEEILDVSALVSLRKNEWYESILEDIPEDEELTKQEKESLSYLISKMDFKEFLTKKEIDTKKLETENSLEDLNIDKEKLLDRFDIETED